MLGGSPSNSAEASFLSWLCKPSHNFIVPTIALGRFRSLRKDCNRPEAVTKEHRLSTKLEPSAAMRLLRIFLFYCALNLLLALPHLVLAWPTFPRSILGWLVLLFFSVPLAVAGEWLFKYRQVRLLRKVDVLGEYVYSSKYRLAIITTILVLVCLLCYGVILLR
jgi:hypothetical protein